MNRRIRLCATVGFAAVLGLGMLPATAWGSGNVSNGQAKSDQAAGSPTWEAVGLYSDGDDCDKDADDGEESGSYQRADCVKVKKGQSVTYVLWVVY